MIFASSLKPNGKMRFSATAGWTQVANGLRLTSTASAASVELHNDYGGISLYDQKDFSIGVKIDQAPVTITNGVAATNNHHLAFAFTALGMLTVTRGYSSPTVTQINLTELGVDISKGIDLVQHWHYDGGVQVLDVYVNEVPVMLGSTRSPLQATYNRIFVAAGAPAPVTLSEIYVKAGDPLLSWKVQDCELAVDNAQNVPLNSVGDSVTAARDMRIAYTLVADEPPAEEIKEVIIEATVPQVKSPVGNKQNLRVAFAGKLLVDKGKLVNPEYGNQFAFNDLSRKEVASPVVVTLSSERSDFDNSNVKEMYYKGVAAAASENLEKDTKPFAYFRFVDGSKDDVSSVYALLSSATVSVGKLHLEGTASSYMELPAFIPSNDFTIEMKFNPTEAGGKLIEVGNLLDIEIDTSLKFRMGAGKIITLDSEVSITLSQECHVAVSSRNGIVQMFVDGVPTARGVSYGRLDPAQVKTVIGRGFKGTISDIRLSFDGLYVVGFEVQPLSEYTPDDSLDFGVLLQEEFLEGSEYGEL